MTKKHLKQVFRKFLRTCKQQLYSLLSLHWPLFVAMVVLGTLLFRNPYNTRTLIPNFEPFPDSFHYVTVSRCFLNHGTWKLCREGIQQSLEGVEPTVPQAYSLALLPAFILNFDPRTFYFTNVVLSFLSLTFLYLILKKITKNIPLRLFVLLLTATSYHVYWLPTLAMAENLLVPLYLLAILLLTKNKSTQQLLSLGAVSAAIYFTKYAYAPLSASIVLFSALQIISFHLPRSKNTLKALTDSSKDVCILLLPILVSIPFSHNFLGSVQFILSIFNPSSTTDMTGRVQTSSYFSVAVAQTYFPKYVEIIIGKPARFLWDLRPWYPPIIGLLGIAGWIVGSIQKKNRLIAGFLVVSSLTQIAFMSTFYAFDSRYTYSAFFAILIGLAIFFEYFFSHKRVLKTLKKTPVTSFLLSVLVLGALGLVVFVPRVMPLKSQVAINLKYAETPWWYLSILEYNAFFANKREEQPQLISLTSPFMIDFFTNNTYVVLPYDEQQDFAAQRDTVWGIPDTESLIDIYTQKLQAGEKLYLANYGKEANDRFRSTFKMYEEAFEVKLEHEGCYNLCNIYSLSLKP